MSVDWRKSPTEEWRTATRRATGRRVKALFAGALAYAATLLSILGAWELYSVVRHSAFREALFWLTLFVGFVVIFGPPALAARTAYMRVMNSTPRASRVHPPDRPTTF